MTSAATLLITSIWIYLISGVVTLCCRKSAKTAVYLANGAGVIAALAGIVSALMILAGSGFRVGYSGFLPFTQLVIEVDKLSAFMVLVICFVSGAVSCYSFSYCNEYREKKPELLNCLVNLFIAAMLLVVTVGNAVYFLIFWEVMTLVSYLLVVYDGDREAVKGGFYYFLVAHAGTALITVSFLLISNAAGSFNFSAFQGVALTPLLRSSVFLLALIGFCAKAGAVPLHFWLPEAHPVAPSNVSALLSGVMIKTAIYGIIRVSYGWLGAGRWWWGFLVLLIGAVSAVLGVIYALAQHDLKRLLAYHSVENIGIILMGVGAGLLGLALKVPSLVAIGLLAGLYHLFNHAVFKGLLFLGAGSVHYSTGTRNLERLGGLVKLMPWTSFFFLVGAVSISALPPLNGFVSEWFTFQSLLTLGLSGGIADKLFAPLFAVLLAMAGALTAMCFVKAYGITFSGPPRSDSTASAREVPFPMLLGKGILAGGCLVLGLGAPWIAPQLAGITSQLASIPGTMAGNGLFAFPGNQLQASLSTPLVALLLSSLLLLPLLLIFCFNANRQTRSDPDPWSCGYQYQKRMSCTVRSFAQPIQAIFRPFYLIRIAFSGSSNTKGYFQRKLVYQVEVQDMWSKFLGEPLSRGVHDLSKSIQWVQMGNIRLYCLYIMAILLVLLLVITL